jgi:hypothetical protein
MRFLVVLVASTILVFCTLLVQEVTQIQLSAQPQGPAPGSAQRFVYTGVGACTASNCHGSVTPRRAPRSDIQGTEYMHWFTKDKHAKAYEVLRIDRSARIAQNLQLTETPEKSMKCLACHTLSIPREAQGRYYQVEDGVSCEACHGPAQRWLGTHFTEGYEASLKDGMYDTRNLVKRAEKCLSCHLGTENKSVDHVMIAAGHPDLIFELDTFTALLPPHWRPPKSEWFGARSWSIGQAVALRETMQRLSRRAQQLSAPGWPEFAEFECFACHHPVQNVESTYYRRAEDKRLKPGGEWLASSRQVRGYVGTLGIPPLNASSYLVFRQLVGQIAPDTQKGLDQKVTDLAKDMAKVGAADPKKIAADATQLAQLADQLIPQVAGVKWNEQLVATLLQDISSNGETISSAGVRVVEQAVMALHTLVVAYKVNAKLPEAASIDQAIKELYKAVEKPEDYDPRQFAARMQAVNNLLLKK